MTFCPYGDDAILINFEQKIDEDINARVMALHHAIRVASVPGITFYIPAYCSLTVGYDRLLTDYDTLRHNILNITENMTPGSNVPKGRTLTIPVCYDNTLALDIEEVMNITGLSKKEIIQWHTGTTFRVYMLGFLPGFAYLGKLPEALHCPRKTTPRLSVPERSVGLAGYQTGIYPSEAPGGWQIIGKTPVKLFYYKKKKPFFFKPGDQVKFKQVSLYAFEHIEAAIASNKFNLDSIYE